MAESNLIYGCESLCKHRFLGVSIAWMSVLVSHFNRVPLQLGTFDSEWDAAAIYGTSPAVRRLGRSPSGSELTLVSVCSMGSFDFVWRGSYSPGAEGR